MATELAFHWLEASNVATAQMTARIYIVDDDSAVRSALSMLVRSYGWQPMEHASAESFLESGFAGNDACLLLDLDMPGMNGAELCEHLSRLGPPIPVVVVTAHQDHPLAARAMAAGAQALIPKPVDGDALLGVLNRCLGTAI